MSPIQTGCAEIPIRTKTIATLSKSERGRSAERTPMGMASKSQKKAPPKTSEAVTGAAFATIEFTSWRFANERPSEGVLNEGTDGKCPKSIGERRPMNLRYWM